MSELPLVTLGAQLVGTAAAVRRGGWRTPAGKTRLVAQAGSAAGLILLHRAAADSKNVLEAALVDGLGPDYRDRAELAGITPPETPGIGRLSFLPSYLTWRGRTVATAVPYGPFGKRNQLDIWAHPSVKPGDKAPVLLQVHGGGWVIGNSRQQAYPLMDRLRTAGWVCVSINYRLSPKSVFPDHIIDVKRAIAWVKDHISEYGGDPDFVVITGGSAGGHLSSLAAVSANDPGFQPGFEDADTSVRAAVPFYGVYDMADWDGKGGPRSTIKFLEQRVLKESQEHNPDLWRRASPVRWVNPDVPPIMLLHGTNDSLVPVEGARRMAKELMAVSRQPVVYAEMPYAQHAFEVYASLRTRHTIRAVERFLAYVRADYLMSKGQAPTEAEIESAGPRSEQMSPQG